MGSEELNRPVPAPNWLKWACKRLSFSDKHVGNLSIYVPISLSSPRFSKISSHKGNFILLNISSPVPLGVFLSIIGVFKTSYNATYDYVCPSGYTLQELNCIKK